jgi:hypothetical protein
MMSERGVGITYREVTARMGLHTIRLYLERNPGGVYTVTSLGLAPTDGGSTEDRLEWPVFWPATCAGHTQKLGRVVEFDSGVVPL